jgi:hypothetical protein
MSFIGSKTLSSVAQQNARAATFKYRSCVMLSEDGLSCGVIVGTWLQKL